MSKIYKYDQLGKGNYGWLKANYHFSFSNYYNPSKVQLGTLRVLNDDTIAPKKGFDTHPHNNMEIVTYVVSGELSHQDSMMNKKSLARHGVQYMSAGTGVLHSEFNDGNEPLHLYQMWILPNEKDVKPVYGDMNIKDLLVNNQLTEIVSGYKGNAPIKIRQSASVSIGEFDKGQTFELSLDDFKYSYLVVVEGTINIDGDTLQTGDAIESRQDYKITFEEQSHLLHIRVND